MPDQSRFEILRNDTSMETRGTALCQDSIYPFESDERRFCPGIKPCIWDCLNLFLFSPV